MELRLPPSTETTWPFEPEVRAVVADLVAGNYAAVVARSGPVRLSAAQLAADVAAFGRRIVTHPEGALLLEVVRIRDVEPPAWYVGVPLWTAEDGRSTLTLELTVSAEPPDRYRVEVDGLHVL